MKILVIKIKTCLTNFQRDTARREIMEMVEKGILILDESFDFEIVDGLVVLKDN